MAAMGGDPGSVEDAIRELVSAGAAKAKASKSGRVAYRLSPAALANVFGRLRPASLPDIGLGDLLSRAEDDGAGCLVWRGYAGPKNMPEWKIAHKGWTVRRLLWEITRGPIRAKNQIGVSCTEPLCVHPDHLVSRTKSVALKGVVTSSATKIRLAMKGRARSRLTIEKVREIRASDLPCSQMDKKMGLCKGYTSRIRLGQVWPDFENPYSGLVKK